MRQMLRIGAPVAAVVAALTASAAFAAAAGGHLRLPQRSSARPAAHPLKITPVVLLEAGPPEPGGRVTLWQNEQLLADEAAEAARAAAAAHPAPAPPPAPAAAPAPRPAVVPRPAAPAPAPPAPAGSIQQIIQQAFAPYGATAVAWGLRVARCESGYNPRAVNPAGPYYGLFQFLMSTFRATPSGSGNIFDPATNAQAAAWKYAHGGAGAWSCN